MSKVSDAQVDEFGKAFWGSNWHRGGFEQIRAALEAVSSIHETEPVARRGEQRTICVECGNSNLAHDRAVWTDDGSSFCPGCYPNPISKGVTEPKWQAIQISDDPAERLAYDLAVELEQADLDRNDFVTVNRAKLLAIAKRCLERLSHNAGEIEAGGEAKLRAAICEALLNAYPMADKIADNYAAVAARAALKGSQL